MRALFIAVVLTLALGFTVKDMTGGSTSPTEAWQDRAESVDESTSLSDTGAELREWLIEQMREAQANK